MSIILNIDTATDTASVSIAKNGEILAETTNDEPKNHGGFIQPAIQALLQNSHIYISDLSAVAISAGPGSYTGLRVGMASAKGLAFALNKPLITIATLDMMAYSAILQTGNDPAFAHSLFCPMIDARRMEVFTALFNKSLQQIINPCTMVLDENSFANQLLKNKIFFLGNGSQKLKPFVGHRNATFLSVGSKALAMSKLSNNKYALNDFANLAYSEPLYLKEFFGAIPRL